MHLPSNESNNIQSLQAQIKSLKEEVETLKSEKRAVIRHVQASEKYLQSQTKFRNVFENSPLGNKIINSDFIILQANKAVSSLLGYSNEEIVGTKILDYVPEEFQKHWKELQVKLWKKQIPVFSLESCLRKKDGTLVCCAITSILFSSQKQLLGYTILEDKTDKIWIDTQKDELIGKVSHELKIPITSIKAFSQILMRSMSSNQASAVDLVYLKRMVIQISQLESLIKDLFDVTRAEGGKLVLNPTYFNAGELLADLVRDFQVGVFSHRLEIIENEPVTIFADKTRFIQVINNLIGNAIKYSPGAGVVNIALSARDSQAVVSVQDFGIGIPEKQANDIFKKFHQLDGAGSAKGLGLGLYISKEIVTQAGGKMWLKSTEGKGSCFYFSIPIHSPQA